MTTRRSAFRFAPALAPAVALAVLAPMPFVLTGCNAMGGAMSPEKAMAMLPEGVKTAVGNYLGGLTDVTKLLGGITSIPGAQSALPKLLGSVNKVADANKLLGSLDSGMKGNVLSAFGKELGEANNGFMSQLSRINGDAGLSSVLGGALKQIQLFK